MTTLVVLSIVWGVMIAGFLALMIYRSHLTNMETDQLFLSDASGTASVHVEQDMIVHRVQALALPTRIYAIAIGLLTVVIGVMYVMQVIMPSLSGRIN
ncbi:hypothetical protein SAMN05421819_1402 [Bryocella elongata]|uniref:Uncharacterized protein n=1 Tax=Bryocella elongata TaxID=863522 RepID=A0A1H5W185_9BACT|nr:hypothetical protein [Bryocella elongata]SEF93245.1 hypothetical protein SAMN05421819_1402 [Bryocella elongata]